MLLADEDDLVPISALQHYIFCPRQCALIHIECLWAENVATMEGHIMHEAVDSGVSERRSGVRIARGIALHSRALGLTGRADAVEFRDTPRAVYPIEYKRGRPKSHRADEVQLCAQAICLEEMLSIAIPAGALFYGEQRRRQNVAFDEELRALTAKVANETRTMLQSGRTPSAKFTSGCKRCSLESLCQPKHFEAPRRIDRWMAGLVERTMYGES